MYDTYEELEKTCERATKELHDLNKKLANDESTISKEDIDMLDKVTHTIASTKKSILMIDQSEDSGSSGRDGYYNISGGYSGGYNTQPMWNRRYANNGSSSRRMSSRMRGSSRDNDMMQMLNDMYQNARDDQEADVIQDIMNKMR